MYTKKNKTGPKGGKRGKRSDQSEGRERLCKCIRTPGHVYVPSNALNEVSGFGSEGSVSHLEALVQDTALALQANILGPADEAVQVTLGGEGTADSEGLGALLEQGVRGGLLGVGLLGHGRGGGRGLLSLGGLEAKEGGWARNGG